MGFHATRVRAYWSRIILYPLVAQEVEANRFWAHEYDNRRRVASAIGQVTLIVFHDFFLIIDR